MLPSLARAREQAKRAVCSNHLKQLWLGVFYYSQGNQDTIPPFRAKGKTIIADPDPANIGWAEMIDRYIPTECVSHIDDQEVYGDVHHCPSKRSNELEGDPGAPITGSYGINGYLSTNVSWALSKPNVVFEWVKFGNLARPAEVVLIGESCRMVTLPTHPPFPRAVVPRHRNLTSSNIAWGDGHVTPQQAVQLVERKRWWDHQWQEGKSYEENGLPGGG